MQKRKPMDFSSWKNPSSSLFFRSALYCAIHWFCFITFNIISDSIRLEQHFRVPSIIISCAVNSINSQNNLLFESWCSFFKDRISNLHWLFIYLCSQIILSLIYCNAFKINFLYSCISSPLSTPCSTIGLLLKRHCKSYIHVYWTKRGMYFFLRLAFLIECNINFFIYGR